MSAAPQLGQRRAAQPDASVWVAASAGAGKTKVLVDRVLGLLLAGTPPQRILCLTFTRAASAEMANRIRDELGEWAVTDNAALEAKIAGTTGKAPDEATRQRARRLFAEVLDAPGGMKIQTIHSFCESVLGRRPTAVRPTAKPRSKCRPRPSGTASTLSRSFTPAFAARFSTPTVRSTGSCACS